MNIIEACKDEKVFRPFLGDDLATWRNWLTCARVVHGLPVKSKRSRKLIRDCMNRDARKLPKGGFDTALILAGRRSGKSRMTAVVGAFAALLAGYESRLARGETGVVPIVSPTKQQGRIVRNYIRGIFKSSPTLEREVVGENAGGFDLKNGTRIEILAGHFAHIRGYTLLTAIVDEIAFFGVSEEARVRSDTELIRALQPSLATTRGRLICIGSPYGRRGWCWEQYKKHFGNDKSKTLVWNCPSRTMNPTLDQAVVDRAMEEDRAAALSEYYGEFRDDVGIFLSREIIDSLVIKGRQELMPRSEHKYSAFVDMSGGRSDASALSIGHKDGNKVVLDVCKLWKSPANPLEVIAFMSEELERFGIKKITGDQFAGEFPVAAFKSHGIKYVPSDKNKSELYALLLPVLCSNSIELLDNDTLVIQLAALERRTRSGGRDIIDHPPRGHDDMANAAAGCAYVVTNRKYIVFKAGII